MENKSTLSRRDFGLSGIASLLTCRSAFSANLNLHEQPARLNNREVNIKNFELPGPTAQIPKVPVLLLGANGWQPTELSLLCQDKPAVVHVLGSWCVPCLAEMPNIIALEKKLTANGVRFIPLANEPPDRAKANNGIIEIYKNNNLNWPVALVPSTPSFFRSVPFTAVINDGHILAERPQPFTDRADIVTQEIMSILKLPRVTRSMSNRPTVTRSSQTYFNT